MNSPLSPIWLLVAALVAFVLATFNVKAKIGLVPLGLALCVAYWLCK
jgi:hypothetical protein